MENNGYRDLEELLKDLNRRIKKVRRRNMENEENPMNYYICGMSERNTDIEMNSHMYKHFINTKKNELRERHSEPSVLRAKDLLNEYFGALDIFLRLPIGDAFNKKPHRFITDIKIIEETIWYLENGKKDDRALKAGDKHYLIDLNKLKKSMKNFEKGVEIITLIRDIFVLINKIRVYHIELPDEKILWDKKMIGYWISKMNEQINFYRADQYRGQARIIEKKFCELSEVIDSTIIETNVSGEMFFDNMYIPDHEAIIEGIRSARLKYRKFNPISVYVYDTSNLDRNPFLTLVDEREPDLDEPMFSGITDLSSVMETPIELKNRPDNSSIPYYIKLGDISNLKIQNSISHSSSVETFADNEHSNNLEKRIIDLEKQSNNPVRRKARGDFYKDILIEDDKIKNKYLLNSLSMVNTNDCVVINHENFFKTIKSLEDIDNNFIRTSERYILSYRISMNKIVFEYTVFKYSMFGGSENALNNFFSKNGYTLSYRCYSGFKTVLVFISLEDFDLNLFFKHNMFKFNLEK